MVSLSYPHINSSNVKSPLTPSWKPNKKTDPIAQVKPILRKGKQRMYNKWFFERMYKKFLIDWKASWGAEQDCNCKSARAKAREAKVEVGSQMEENEGGGGGTGTETYSHIWWALASAAQLGWAISSFERSHAGDSHFMPFKAFSVASLFVGAIVSTAVSVLHCSDIHKVRFSLSLSLSLAL